MDSYYVRNLIVRASGCPPSDDVVEMIMRFIVESSNNMNNNIELPVDCGLNFVSKVTIVRAGNVLKVKGRLGDFEEKLDECAEPSVNMYGNPPSGIQRIMKCFGKRD